MAVTTNWYGLAHKDQWGAGTAVSFTADTIKVSLHTVTYVVNQDTDEFWTAATNEISGTGYTARGVALTGKSLTYDTTTNEARLIASNASWTSSSFTARTAVVYKDTGTNGTSVLLGYVGFGADQTVASGTFTIQWDATGVLKTVAS